MGDGTEVISGRPVSEKPVVSEKYGPDVREEPLSSRWGYSHPTFDNVNPEDPLEGINIPIHLSAHSIYPIPSFIRE